MGRGGLPARQRVPAPLLPDARLQRGEFLLGMARTGNQRTELGIDRELRGTGFRLPGPTRLGNIALDVGAHQLFYLRCNAISFPRTMGLVDSVDPLPEV